MARVSQPQMELLETPRLCACHFEEKSRYVPESKEIRVRISRRIYLCDAGSDAGLVGDTEDKWEAIKVMVAR